MWEPPSLGLLEVWGWGLGRARYFRKAYRRIVFIFLALLCSK